MPTHRSHAPTPALGGLAPTLRSERALRRLARPFGLDPAEADVAVDRGMAPIAASEGPAGMQHLADFDAALDHPVDEAIAVATRDVHAQVQRADAWGHHRHSGDQRAGPFDLGHHGEGRGGIALVQVAFDLEDAAGRAGRPVDVSHARGRTAPPPPRGRPARTARRPRAAEAPTRPRSALARPFGSG